jgi:hypothetical protein
MLLRSKELTKNSIHYKPTNTTSCVVFTELSMTAELKEVFGSQLQRLMTTNYQLSH